MRSRSRWPTARCCRSGICAAAPPSHVKVALSGEGGDEVLGGYARYFWGPVVDDLQPSCCRPRADRMLGMTSRFPSRSLGIFNVFRRAAKGRRPPSTSTRPRATSPGSTSSPRDERRELVGDGHDGAADRYDALFAAADELRPGSGPAPAVRRLPDDAARQPAAQGRQDLDGAQPGGQGSVPRARAGGVRAGAAASDSRSARCATSG